MDTQVAYILSLGVVKEFRKHGIGTAVFSSTLRTFSPARGGDSRRVLALHREDCEEDEAKEGARFGRLLKFDQLVLTAAAEFAVALAHT